DARFGKLAARALHHLLDLVNCHAEMIEPADIAVAHRIDVEADIAVADIGAADRPALSFLGSLQAEHRLVEPPHHRPVGAVDGDVVDLGKHGVFSLAVEPQAAASRFGGWQSSRIKSNRVALPRRCARPRGSPHFSIMGTMPEYRDEDFRRL